MTTVVTDNLDEHTILSLTVSTLANVYCERPTPVAKLNRNVLCEEFDDIKHSHQYTRNLHSFILSRCGYILKLTVCPYGIGPCVFYMLYIYIKANKILYIYWTTIGI